MNAKQPDRLASIERRQIEGMTDEQLAAIVGNDRPAWPRLCTDQELDGIVNGEVPPRVVQLMRRTYP